YVNLNFTIDHVNTYSNTGLGGGVAEGFGMAIGDVNGGVIQYCVAHDNGWLNDIPSGPVGIMLWDANGVTVQCNESYHNGTAGTGDGDGIDFDKGTTNSVMQYNYTHDNANAGLMIYSESPSVTTNNVIRYNISENDCRVLASGGIWVSGNPANVEVY